MADKVKIGFIGSGGIARGHAKRLAQTPGAELIAYADPEPDTIERIRSHVPEFAEAKGFPDWREMLDAVELDAVEIHSPHSFHPEQIIESLKRGLHVLTEKPMVNSIAEAKEVLGAWKESGKILTISYQRQFRGPYRLMREAIGRGEIGEVTQVNSFLSQNWYSIPPTKWRMQKKLSCGGELHDSGSHILNVVTWVPRLEAEEVTAWQEFFDREVDINTVLNVRFRGGALASIFIAGRAPVFYEDMSIVGTDGAFFLRKGTLKLFKTNPRTEVLYERVDDYSNPDANFVDAILGRDEPVVSPVDGLRVIEITEAAWKSAEAGGKPVKVEKFDF